MEVFTDENFVADFFPIELVFYSQKRHIHSLSHPLEELGVTYALHL